MNKSLPRENTVYKDIENFNEHEINICVAYEFTIRNQEVIELIKKFLNLHSENLLSYCDYKPILSTDIFRDKTSRYYNIHAIQLMDKKCISVLNLFLDYPWFDALIKQYKSKEKQYIRQRIDYELETIKDINNFPEYKQKLINREKYINEYNQIFFQYKNDNEIENIEDDFIFRYITKSSYNLTQIYHTDDTYNIMTNTIKPNYKRPELLGNFSKMKNYNIEINQNLPQKDIEAFVKDVLNDIYSSNRIKSYSELLGEDLEKANKILYINKKTNKIDTQTLADMFYIYDSINKDVKKSIIQMGLTNYHDKHLVDYGTINKYLDIAKEYIDKLKYKELITGLKN
ncbi:MAG: hypothetical protein PHD79_03670 [Aliarcobacter sp.]|nr:hypothetical protein [Aliarcobacter sp.]